MTALGRCGVGLLAVLTLLIVLPPPIILPLFIGAEATQAWPVLWVLAAGTGAMCLLVATQSIPLAVLLAWGWARTLWADIPLRSLIVVLGAVAGLALYLLAARLPARADRWLLAALAAAALVTAWIGLEQVLGVGWTVGALQALTGALAAPWGLSAVPQETSLRLEGSARAGLVVRATVLGQPHGLLGHPNTFGVFLAVALPAILWAARSWLPPRCRRLGGGAVGAGLLAMVLLSRSRTALLALGLVGVAWLLPHLARRAKILLLGGLLAAATLAGAGILLGAWTLGTRTQAWALGWQTALAAPWVGWGLGTWRLWAMAPQGPIARWTGVEQAGWWQGAFNEPLQLFFELGAVGLEEAEDPLQTLPVFQAAPQKEAFCLKILRAFNLNALARKLGLEAAKLRFGLGQPWKTQRPDPLEKPFSPSPVVHFRRFENFPEFPRLDQRFKGTLFYFPQIEKPLGNEPDLIGREVGFFKNLPGQKPLLLPAETPETRKTPKRKPPLKDQTVDFGGKTGCPAVFFQGPPAGGKPERRKNFFQNLLLGETKDGFCLLEGRHSVKLGKILVPIRINRQKEKFLFGQIFRNPGSRDPLQGFPAGKGKAPVARD
ncbi:MAG: O-antigen ligase family protein [Elusimicrobia bacterium]|nr:O-antigen ligase family protein [Elusimicrobiota bacterium]